jgi:Protein of unknown function (DUF1579)
VKTQLFVATVLFLGLVCLAPSLEGKPPSEREKRLEYFLGTWDVSVQFKLPDGKAGEGKAVCQTKWVLDGKFLRQEYKSKFMGQPLIVWQLLGYDDMKKEFVEFQLHADVKGAHTMHNEGTFSENGKVLTLAGDSIDGFTGKPVKLRTVTTILDENRYTVEWFTGEPSGKEERKVVLTHTRKT